MLRDTLEKILNGSIDFNTIPLGVLPYIESNGSNDNISNYSPTGIYNAIIAPQGYIHRK